MKKEKLLRVPPGFENEQLNEKWVSFVTAKSIDHPTEGKQCPNAEFRNIIMEAHSKEKLEKQI